MARYYTFNIKFTDWYDNEREYYEIAQNTAEALEKFYDEIKQDKLGLTRIKDIYKNESDNYYIVVCDGDTIEYRFDTPSELFYDISKTYAFDDCYYYDEFEIKQIVYGGRSIRYIGWQPCMKFEYRYNDTNEIAWTCYHEEWDHQ